MGHVDVPKKLERVKIMSVAVNGAFFVVKFKKRLFNKMKWERIHPKCIIDTIRQVFPQYVQKYSLDLMNKERALTMFGIFLYFIN